jgi:hypothetical protein
LVEDLFDAERTAAPFVDQLFDPGPPSPDERELGSHEETVCQQQQGRSEQIGYTSRVIHQLSYRATPNQDPPERTGFVPTLTLYHALPRLAIIASPIRPAGPRMGSKLVAKAARYTYIPLINTLHMCLGGVTLTGAEAAFRR